MRYTKLRTDPPSNAGRLCPRRHRPVLAAFFTLLVAGIPCQPAAQPDGGTDTRPNILVFLSDDMGWGQPGFNGGTEVATPNMDRIANEGVKLTQFYVQPVCSPTRASLLTGRYSWKNGMDLRPEMWARQGMLLDERTIAEALRDVGYATWMVGKWHLGHWQREHLPRQRGFDHHYGLYGFGIHSFNQNIGPILDWHRNGRPVVESGYSTFLLADEAVRLIQRHDGRRPFFLYLPFNAPHSPHEAPEEYIEEYRHLPDGSQRAQLKAMDVAIGRVMDALDVKGVLDNTLIMFLNDNGGTGKAGRNSPYRGWKGNYWEGGIRVPSVLRWPGEIPPGSETDALLHVVDLFPTFAGLAGADTTAGLPLDGLDAWNAIANGAESPRNEVVHSLDVIRVGDWKLIEKDAYFYNSPPEYVHLFNIRADPYETRPLAAREPAKVAELRARLAQHRQFAREGEAFERIPNYPPVTYGADENEEFAAEVRKAWQQRARGNLGPSLVHAALSGDGVRLVFDEALDGESMPPASAFKVVVNPGYRSAEVTAVEVGGSDVVLTLSLPVQSGETVGLTYEVPTVGAIRDLDGIAAVGVTWATTLAGSFEAVPSAHEGVSFTLRLRFSEPVSTSASALVDSAFEVTGGQLTQARQVEGGGALWELTLVPSGLDAVVVTLPETTDCAAAGAVCTADAKPLSNRLQTTIPRAAMSRDIPADRAGGHMYPRGAWSDGETIWVADNADRERVYAYRLSDGARTASRDVLVERRSLETGPLDLWSDGETLWASEGYEPFRLAGYRLSDGARRASRDVNMEGKLSAHLKPTGLWSDGETAWVVNLLGQVHAYRLSDGERRPEREWQLSSEQGDPWGLWSDGTTFWVGDHGDARAYAYRSGARVPELDLAELERGNYRVRGLWSDGHVMWLVDRGAGHLYAYPLPGGPSSHAALVRLSATGADLGAFEAAKTSYAGTVVAEWGETTIKAFAASGATVSIAPADASNAPGHQVSLAPGANEVSLTVTAADGVTQRSYGLTLTRAAVEDHTALPEVLIGAVADSVAEGAPARFEVSLEEAAESDIEVAVSVAEAGSVLSGTAPTSVTVAGGATSATLTVPTHDDAVIEADGSVTASLASGTGYSVGSRAAATVTVADNDTAMFAVTASPPEIGTGESSTVTVSIDNGVTYASDRTITLNPSGTAKRADYRLSSETLLLAAGSASVSAALTAVANPDREAAATLVVMALLDGTTLGTATVTIRTDAVEESDDATLSSLTLSGIDLGTFAPDTTAYAATVANSVSSTAVTAQPNDAGASVRIADANGSAPGTRRTVPLAEGGNEIAVTVTAADGQTQRTYTVTVTRSKAPLTASFVGMPVSHDGTRFAFRVRFSEAIADGYENVRDHAFAVTGGKVNGARRVNGPSDSAYWEISVLPDGDDDISIVLPADRPCFRAGAICTSDGRRLSTRLQATVAGPEPEPPDRVTGVTVTAQVEALSVSWTAVDDADGYKVQWREDGASYDAVTRQHEVAAGLTSRSIADLTAGTTYRVRVAATRNGVNDGPWSAEASGTPRSAEDVVDGDLRLIGGQQAHEGRLEIFHDGQWGTMCNDFWELQDARVACRQLGYADATEAVRSPRFGQGSGPIWMDNVHCAGDEARLTDCPFNGWGDHNCGHHEDAGAVCAVGIDAASGISGAAVPTVVSRLLGPTPEEASGSPVRGAPGASADSTPLADLIGSMLAGRPASSLTTLDLTDRKLGDLSGIERLTGLQVLRMRGNVVSDLSPLSALTRLRALDASDNAVVDLWPLSVLYELRLLDLSDNAVSDLSPVSGLATLTALDLGDNAVSDLRALTSLIGLERLLLPHNRVADLGPLTGLVRLQELDVSGNAVAQLWPLAGLAHMQHLGLRDNAVSDLWPLAGLARLRMLDVSGNRIGALDALAGAIGLRTLRVDRNQVAALHALTGIQDLNALSLRDNTLRDVNPLMALPDLRWLDLSGNPVTTLGALPDFGVLVWIDSETVQLGPVRPTGVQIR